MDQRVPDNDLREFLKSRRARLTPQQAGIAPYPGARRVPGLRREEVAQLAGVSVDYYMRLERGRTDGVSVTVLEALSRALQLDDTERRHLFALAQPNRRPPDGDAAQQARPGLLLALDNLADLPALLLGHRLDVLAANRLARALYLDFDATPAGEWNLARYMFLTDAARELYLDWPEHAQQTAGMLRLYGSHHPHDPGLARLVDELSAGAPEFSRWWAEHDVFLPRYGSKRYRHPHVGELTLGFEAFMPLGDPDQILGLYTVEPGSPSENALRMLAASI